MFQVYEIDGLGFLCDIHVVEHDETLSENIIKVRPPNGLYKAKWNGSEWIEGATQEEINEVTKVEPSPPTEMELLKGELTKTNEMLLDMMELLIGGM